MMFYIGRMDRRRLLFTGLFAPAIIRADVLMRVSTKYQVEREIFYLAETVDARTQIVKQYFKRADGIIEDMGPIKSASALAFEKAALEFGKLIVRFDSDLPDAEIYHMLGFPITHVS